MQTRKKGFTLIELIITIALIAVIATLAAPSLGDLLEKQKLKKSTDELIAVLKEARAKSILEAKNVTLKLDSDAKDDGYVLNWKPTSPSKMKTFAGNEIKFTRQGFYEGYIDSKPPKIQLCQNNGVESNLSKTITLDKFGKIAKIETGSCP